MNKFFIKTFGCQMNKHDSEKIAGLLIKEGYKICALPEEADVIIFNTCSVRKHAEERFYGFASSLKSLKQKKKFILAIGGCTGQKEGERILKRIPFADIIFGTFNIASLPELIKKVRKDKVPVVDIKERFNVKTTSLPSLRKSHSQAWITIITGCNNFCSYCVVPYVRGREISRPIEEIVEEVKRLSEEGVVEITLLGQNVNSYGKDLYGRGKFAHLLYELEKLDRLKRIRFATSHPKDLSDEIIEATANCSKVCEHLHLPVQAGSTKILKLMNRKYTKESYLELIEKVKQKIPEVSITTDIIVGFPGESEEDFLETIDLVKKAQFDQIFSFIYSPREGTPAFNLQQEIPYHIKLERFKRLIRLQNEISLSRNALLLGKVVEVFVEGISKKSKDFLTGRTRTNKVVNFKGNSEWANQFKMVKVKEAHPFHLIGEALSNFEETKRFKG